MGLARIEYEHSSLSTPYFLDQMLRLLFLFSAYFNLCGYCLRGCLFLLKTRRHQQRLDKVCRSDTVMTVNSTQPLSSAISLGEELYNTNSPSASPLTVILNYPHTCACALYTKPWLLFEGGVYFDQSFQFCCYYSIAATIREWRWHLFEVI